MYACQVIMEKWLHLAYHAIALPAIWREMAGKVYSGLLPYSKLQLNHAQQYNIQDGGKHLYYKHNAKKEYRNRNVQI